MDLTKMSGEELALLLNQVYGQLLQAQGNIQAINNELLKRKSIPEVVKE